MSSNDMAEKLEKMQAEVIEIQKQLDSMGREDVADKLNKLVAQIAISKRAVEMV